MKINTFYLFFYIFNFFTLNAQTVSTIIDANSNCMGLTIDEDFLYVSSTFNGQVHKFNITQSNSYQTYNTITNGSQYTQNGICKYGDYILLARGSQNKIIKFVPDIENILVEDVISVPSPNGIAIRNSDLFISSTDKIYKVDLAASTLSLVQIASNIQGVSYWTTGTIGIKIYDDYLYVAEVNGISKINLNSGNYEKELITSYTGSSFAKGNDNTLYLTGTTATNEIFQLNLSTQNYSVLVQLNQFDYPNTYDICYANGSLFVTCLESSKVAQIELDALSFDDLEKKNILLYPNPSSNYLIIEGFQLNDEITIINSLGQIIKSFKLMDNSINISDLEAGTYFVKNKNYYKRFIKR